MRWHVRILSVFLATGLFLQAKEKPIEWPPIPKEIWDIKPDVTKGIKDAYILEQETFFLEEMRTQLRIRILSETGEKAVSRFLPEGLLGIEGRTIQPDGQITLFNQAKDLIQLNARIGDSKLQEKTFIPPGISKNCVVDISIRSASPLPTQWLEVPILGPYPVQKRSIHIPLIMLNGHKFLGLGTIKVDWKLLEKTLVCSFQNLPVKEPEPFAVESAFEDPRLLFYLQPPQLHYSEIGGPETYWNAVGSIYLKEMYGTMIDPGSRYKNWSKELRQNLSGSAQERAATLLQRLQQQILNLDTPTLAELAALPGGERDRKINPWDLDKSVKTKRTTGQGMLLLFFRLLKDEGLQPSLLLVENRRKGVFDPAFPCVFQLTDTLVALPSEEGKLTIFIPSSSLRRDIFRWASSPRSSREYRPCKSIPIRGPSAPMTSQAKRPSTTRSDSITRLI
jgi:hypothetical protein